MRFSAALLLWFVLTPWAQASSSLLHCTATDGARLLPTGALLHQPDAQNQATALWSDFIVDLTTGDVHWKLGPESTYQVIQRGDGAYDAILIPPLGNISLATAITDFIRIRKWWGPQVVFIAYDLSDVATGTCSAVEP